MGYRTDMLLIDILEANPKTAQVLASFGLKCENCIVAESETLEAGARAYGLDPAVVLAKLEREAPIGKKKS